MGHGLVISNRRKSKKPAISIVKFTLANGKNTSHTPKTSSITICDASLQDSSFSAWLAATAPIKNIANKTSMRPMNGKGKKYMGANIAANSEPQVPGATGAKPATPARQKKRHKASRALYPQKNADCIFYLDIS